MFSFSQVLLSFLVKILYKVHVIGSANLPIHGPALLVSNHVSFMDKAIIRISLGRRVCFLSFLSPFKVLEALKKGKIVCLFPEGQVSESGHLFPFQKSVDMLLKALEKETPIIPLLLSGIWCKSYKKLFSVSTILFKRSLWKFRATVKVLVGEPIFDRKASASFLFQKIQDLAASDEAITLNSEGTLGLYFLNNARRSLWKFSMADSSGYFLRFFQVLISTVLISKRLKQHIHDEKNIGVLLPSCVPGALVNLSLALLGRVVVNLNFTVSKQIFHGSCEKANVQKIITSKMFLKKLGDFVDEKYQLIYLESLLERIGFLEKIRAFFQGLFWPKKMLLKSLGGGKKKAHDLATIVFSSGSTGVPKGICLSHKNILANCQGISQVLHTRPKDVLMGVLPFFHSFGYTGTIWFPLLRGIGVVYHNNPMEGKKVARLVEKFKATLFISTPTFYQIYTHSCRPSQFSSLRVCIAGAEKASQLVRQTFEELFKVPLLEGYGCTELSPVVSVNTPTTYKQGSVGRLLPNIFARCVKSDDFSTLPIGEEGALLIKGPNVMEGYLNDSEQTAKVIRDGWYVTGDRAFIDDEGFLHITGRLSRFSKIGGEMVPHLKVEEALNEVLGSDSSLVVSVNDKRKGEALVVLYVHEKMCPEDLLNSLRKQPSLPNLWIPKPSHVFSVKSLPLLGSGKFDLKKAQQLANEKLRDSLRNKDL
jgi:acyl-[acyl-carrier-protein]-phospholipid O-acyltransferase / long-chain-fatty-acid--[acyl-carrier-protein] ligase